jgi:Beta-glucosidase-related glycosidases
VAELSLIEKAGLLSGENTWQTRPIERLGIPQIWMSDGPHGIRKQVGSADHLGLNGSEKATCFPTAATIAGSWDEELAASIGQALGREAAAQNVNVLLGPGLNIKRSPLGGRGFEYFAEDPELAGRLAAAYVRGIQSQGVAATPKHFAVNSQELRRMVSDSVIDERTLREIYLTAFEIVVREAAPWAIMSSYNLVNGSYAHENSHLLTDVLRTEWGFDGAVISDWGGSNDASCAVTAGGTIEMPSPGYDSVRQIVAAVQSGRVPLADLDARVREVLTLVDRVRQGGAAAAEVDLSAHHALARRPPLNPLCCCATRGHCCRSRPAPPSASSVTSCGVPAIRARDPRWSIRPA